MERLLETAASQLFGHPSPALPLVDVERELSRTSPPVRIRGDALVRWLSLRSDLFLILDPWKAIVTHRLSAERPTEGWRPDERRRPPVVPGAPFGGFDDATRGPWVVALSDPCDAAHPRVPRGALGVLRESVVWVSRSIDGESTRALVRWLRMAAEAQELMSDAAPPVAA